LGQVYARCCLYDPVESNRIIDSTEGKKIDAKIAKDLCVELYIKVLSNNIVGRMEHFVSDKFRCYYYNVYSKLQPNSAFAIDRAIKAFQEEANFDVESGTVCKKSATLSNTIGSLMAIHECLLEPLVRRVINLLTTKPRSRAVIFLHYSDTIEICRYMLAQYNPVILTGEVPKDQRQGIVDVFRHEEGRMRVLICNAKVTGVGLSMHSVIPGVEISAFTVPFWDIIVIIQVSGRIYRISSDGVVNNAYFHIIYPDRKRALLIQKIGEALNRSGEVMKTSIKSIEQGTTLPQNYESIEE